MLQEFKKFALRGNVIDLAVGIIIGTAFTAIVNSLVNDILMPPLGLVIGGIDFSEFFIRLKGPHVDTLAAAKAAGTVTLNYGLFINAIIKFVIIAFAVFFLIRQMNKLIKQKDDAPPPTLRSEVLLEEIRDALRNPKPAI